MEGHELVLALAGPMVTGRLGKLARPPKVAPRLPEPIRLFTTRSPVAAKRVLIGGCKVVNSGPAVIPSAKRHMSQGQSCKKFVKFSLDPP
jgi:hypothetical protein